MIYTTYKNGDLGGWFAVATNVEEHNFFLHMARSLHVLLHSTCMRHARLIIHTSCYVWGEVGWGNNVLVLQRHVLLRSTYIRHAMSGVGWGGGNNVMVLRRHVLDRHDFYTYHTCYATSCSLVLDILNISAALHHDLWYLTYLTNLLRYIMFCCTWHTQHICYATSCSRVLDIFNTSSTLHHVLWYLTYLKNLLHYIMFPCTWHT